MFKNLSNSSRLSKYFLFNLTLVILSVSHNCLIKLYVTAEPGSSSLIVLSASRIVLILAAILITSILKIWKILQKPKKFSVKVLPSRESITKRRGTREERFELISGTLTANIWYVRDKKGIRNRTYPLG